MPLTPRQYRNKLESEFEQKNLQLRVGFELEYANKMEKLKATHAKEIAEAEQQNAKLKKRIKELEADQK